MTEPPEATTPVPTGPTGWVPVSRPPERSAAAAAAAAAPVATAAPAATAPVTPTAPSASGSDPSDPRPQGAAPKHQRSRRKPRKPRSSVRSAVEWVAVIVGALVVALVVKTFLFQAFYIPSASMEPTLKKGDRVLVNKLSYDVHDIHRGDVVVFELPPDQVEADGIKDLIKRVVGLPGEEIESIDGQVYIDGKLLEEPYLPAGTTTDKPPIRKQVVPDGHIFVMGDNRDNSADSRFPSRGPVPIDTVVGRAFLQVWPPSGISGL